MTRISGALPLALMPSTASQSTDVPTELRIHPIALMVLAFAQLCRAVALELHRRKEARTLRALDDRMLADIGLQRGQIDRAVRTGRYSLVSSASGF